MQPRKQDAQTTIPTPPGFDLDHAYQNKINYLNNQIQYLLTHITELKNEHANTVIMYQEKIAEKDEEILTSQYKKSVAEQDKLLVEAELAKAKMELAQLKLNIIQINKDSANLQNCAVELRKQLQAANTLHKKISDEKRSLESQAQHLRNENDNCLQIFYAKFSSKERQIVELQKQIQSNADIAERLAAVQKKLDLSEESSRASSAAITTLRAEILHLTTQNETQLSKINFLELEQAKLKKELASSNSTFQSKILHLETEIKNLDKQKNVELNDQKIKYDDLQKQFSDLTHTLSPLKDENAKLKYQFSLALNNLKTITRQHNQLIQEHKTSLIDNMEIEGLLIDAQEFAFQTSILLDMTKQQNLELKRQNFNIRKFPRSRSYPLLFNSIDLDIINLNQPVNTLGEQKNEASPSSKV